ncbi:MAG TPA: RNA methyltransferase [Gillisia sp.]|nr:RNA methyltransferase [Gillisia sp.]
MEKRKLKNSELERKTVEEFRDAEKTPLIVILDNVRSLNNIGSVFRTCDAFLIKKVYLCGITATPPHKDIHKTALGATETVTWEFNADTREVVKDLQQEGIEVFAVEQAENAIMLQEFTPSSGKTIAVIFGNEVKGVQQGVVDACNGVIEIPQHGSKHSLNIAVSAGIIIWDIFKKMKW